MFESRAARDYLVDVNDAQVYKDIYCAATWVHNVEKDPNARNPVIPPNLDCMFANTHFHGLPYSCVYPQ